MIRKSSIKPFLKKTTVFVIAVVFILSIYIVVSLQLLKLTSKDKRSVDLLAEELVQRRLLPSISYAVIVKGTITSVNTLGVADYESGVEVNAKTLYEAASLTKPFIAEIARRLYNNRIFSLDEKISSVISNSRIDHDPRWQLLTPRHLLSHTSGLPNWSGDSRDPDRTDRLNFDFTPGSSFQYSGEGYGLLLSFLEAKSGRSLENLAHEFFNELGMTNSTLIGYGYKGHFARGHWRDSPNRESWKTKEPIAAYSLFTNSKDYALFLRYVIEQHARDKEIGNPFPTVQIEIKSERSGEVLGWSLGWGTLERAEDTIYFQWGDNGAFRSFAAFDPISQNGIVYFTNGSFGTIYSDELAAPVLGSIETATSWFSSEAKEIIRTWLKI